MGEEGRGREGRWWTLGVESGSRSKALLPLKLTENGKLLYVTSHTREIGTIDIGLVIVHVRVHVYVHVYIHARTSYVHVWCGVEERRSTWTLV